MRRRVAPVHEVLRVREAEIACEAARVVKVGLAVLVVLVEHAFSAPNVPWATKR
jgi:hypothetical protein